MTQEFDSIFHEETFVHEFRQEADSQWAKDLARQRFSSDFRVSGKRPDHAEKNSEAKDVSDMNIRNKNANKYSRINNTRVKYHDRESAKARKAKCEFAFLDTDMI